MGSQSLVRFAQRRRFSGLTSKLAAFALVLCSGCALLVRHEDASSEASARRAIAIVEFADETDQALGLKVARIFWEETRKDLDAEITSSLLPRPGQRLSDAWLRSQARRERVGAFLSATIRGYRVQETQQRVWVALTVRLLDADSGRIRWSQRMVEVEPIPPHQAPEVAFERAVRTAAREFTHAHAPSR